MLTERRVLVTGGAGFIGSHLCERLLERGDEVLCVDNFYTGTRRNVQRLLSNGLFELMRHDVCFPLYVEVDEIFNLACPASPIHYQLHTVHARLWNGLLELMRNDVCFPLYVEVDEIFNLACPASPIHYQFDPVQTTKTSVHGAINMLGLAKRVKAKILQASTSEVYGDPDVHPQPECYWGKVN